VYLVSGVDWDNPYFRAVLYRALRRFKDYPDIEMIVSKTPFKSLNQLIKGVKSLDTLNNLSKDSRVVLKELLDYEILDDLPGSITRYEEFESRSKKAGSTVRGIQESQRLSHFIK